MIVPCIDLSRGHAVQLVGGESVKIDAGDPIAIAERFRRVGDIAVVDIDAARGDGDNADLIRELVRIAPCRVGGGIRDLDTAKAWLDAGATKVVLGTCATPEFLRELPRDRCVAALDARDGEVVVAGWRERTGHDVFERMREIRGLVSEFLVTQVEREGRMVGADLEFATRLRETCGDAKLTFAGGIRTAEEIAELDSLGIDAQVGMAIYSESLDLADAFLAPVHSDRNDGLWPTVVTDERGVALGLCWSSRESVREAIRSGRGTYQSRRRGLWVKGESSGATQELVRIEADCDRDALRFTVRQAPPGFCHNATHTCWGDTTGLDRLQATLSNRRQHAPQGSYTRRLFDDGSLLEAKLVEEARELSEARERADVVHEAADVIYFASVAMARAGVSLAEVERELDRRSLRLTRRGGERKS